MIATENARVTFLLNPAQWPFKDVCRVRRITVRDSSRLTQLGLVFLWPAGHDRDAEVVPVLFEPLLQDRLHDPTWATLARAQREHAATNTAPWWNWLRTESLEEATVLYWPGEKEY